MAKCIETSSGDQSEQPPGILLIEDYEDLAQVIKLLLESEGYTVKSASTIAEAVRAVRNHRYGLVVSDWTLPDGKDALQQLRHHGRFKAIALSGYEGGEHVAACREAGFAECLVKPVDDRQLLSSIRRLLDDSFGAD